LAFISRKKYKGNYGSNRINVTFNLKKPADVRSGMKGRRRKGGNCRW